MPLLLGIDIGTASSKGVITRPDGELVAQAVREHRTSSPRPGWFEHDAEAVWWRDLRELLADLGTETIAAVGVSGIGPCLLPVDEADGPLRPAILYGIDTRTGEQIAAQAVGPKLAWLRQREPELYGRTRRWYMASSYLVRRLTGAYVLDHHSASQCTPLYDVRDYAWIGDWCEEIAPGLEWPRLVWPSETVGTVTRSAAAAPVFRRARRWWRERSTPGPRPRRWAPPAPATSC